MKKEIQKLIPTAVTAVEKYLMTGAEVQKEYDGYAASLGAAIRNSGLIPALCFYTDISRTSGDARRWRLLMAIHCTLHKSDLSPDTANDQKALLDQVIKEVYGENSFDNENSNPAQNSQRTTDQSKALSRWNKDILNASIALKLAMRNFPHTQNEN